MNEQANKQALKEGHYPSDMSITEFIEAMEEQTRKQSPEDAENHPQTGITGSEPQNLFFSRLARDAEKARKEDSNDPYNRRSRGWGLNKGRNQ